jgi:hypothetical protein
MGDSDGGQPAERAAEGHALALVVQRLHKEVFLVALGIGILLVALAVSGAGEAVVPVAIALVVVLVIAIVGWQLDERGGQRSAKAGPHVGNVIKAGRRSQIEDVRQAAINSSGADVSTTNELSAGAGAMVSDVVQAANSAGSVVQRELEDMERIGEAPALTSVPFVGRAEILSAVQDDLAAPGPDVIVEVVEGLPGSGKTMLLKELCRRAECYCFLEMERFATQAPSKAIDPESKPAERAFQNYAEVLIALAARATKFSMTTEFAGFLKSAPQAKKAPATMHMAVETSQQVKTGGRIESSPQVSVVVNPGQPSIETAAAAITEAFSECWAAWSRERRMLIALDDWERVRDEPIAQWLLPLADRLSNALIVVARRSSDEALGTRRRVTASHTLSDFTSDEVRQCLEGRLKETVPPEVVDVVHWFSDGHAAIVGMVCDLVDESDMGSRPEALRDVLRRLPKKEARKVTELVESILRLQDLPGLEDAVRAASIVPQFDTPLLAALLQGDDGHIDARELVEALDRYSITEQLQVKNQHGIENDVFRLHRFVREKLLQDLKTMDPDRVSELHDRAAKYYFQRLVDEDAPGGGYGEWYRYEKPEWQQLKSEWLYHVAFDSDGRDQVRLHFARVFIDAFWWWGCYMPFQFCNTILQDLKDVIVGDQDLLLADSLTTVLECYPTGWRKPPGPHWMDVRVALLNVLDVCGLQHEALRTQPEQRHVAGLCSVFLAHCWRYEDLASSMVDTNYDQAKAMFEADDDWWDLGFIAVERADVAIDRGDPDGARVYANEAAMLAMRIVEQEGAPDEELITNIERVRADAHWSQCEYRLAVDRYCSAITHAYLFQNHRARGPDAYSREFYDEQLQRLAGRLETAAASGDPAVRRALIDGLWAANLAGGRTATAMAELADDSGLRHRGTAACLDLVRRVFPRGPAIEEFGVGGSPFRNEWVAITEGLDKSGAIDITGAVGHEVEAGAP